ncbi:MULTISPECIES: zinc-dependent alcohol dehydrogenase family protein [Pseudoalteromonas]|uniref:zinc-dependent alcohol dehydrogenase family protein n=1 Tax=Pseudoalteromonas TaxID=53246 RepID=UPI000F645950|nr:MULTISPECIES: zinc-dependent alcohol dehydrogenase family protein [Pseudoalteromonas]MBR8841851.1 zinc-dependent alcohol dehydrogenase family protein [Pseudoalteromonas sp. JC3]RRS06490.1 alcohol dehydrogenase [Pseudoalteromonas sp. J010]UDM63657.1 zinc-dependent alcohol dehydrogenase family protein [Pseudoalteromonas piscicida]WJE11152.1 zinc-dependent alcohol dehydrogenase family protein [Pseudoalteromonas sp. JC3]
MKAVVYEKFGQAPKVMNVKEPELADDGVIINVRATGVCRSDWHGWKGHDSGIELPHVPGHEFAGVVEAVGKNVRHFKVGERVTVPFVNGCGSCPDCHSGNQQVCSTQTQPGFTHWGSFAEYVPINNADTNLVHLPDDMDFATAASLGCRFVTSFRAVVDQGKVKAGQWVAVHGCGGVGLSAIMIANSIGANVIAVDIAEDKLTLARSLGAVAVINASKVDDVAEAIMSLTRGGAHVSLDALGHSVTCVNSIKCLRSLGKHVQVGLLLGDQAAPNIPMSKVIAQELEIIGSHGMQAFRYQDMLAMMLSGKLAPEKLIGQRINLEQSIDALTTMDSSSVPGVTVVTEF